MGRRWGECCQRETAFFVVRLRRIPKLAAVAKSAPERLGNNCSQRPFQGCRVLGDAALVRCELVDSRDAFAVIGIDLRDQFRGDARTATALTFRALSNVVLKGRIIWEWPMAK